MKTFFDLIQEVQKPGLCHRCGACVTFCTAINYGALDLDADGKPRYGEIEKCIECGLCHAICPEVDELEEDTRRRVAWSAPIGRVIEATVARAQDPAIREKATDGGVVTAVLLHLLERGRIDGAIVTKQIGPFQRRPYLATTPEDIQAAAGFFFDTSHGMKAYSDAYMTYSSIEEFDPMVKKGLKRVALVGTPCQIKSVRRMQTLDIVPADAIQICLGLFCSGNFVFGDEQRAKIAAAADFDWENVRKINIKERLLVHLTNGEKREIDLEQLDFMRRYACQYCPDYAAEFADISFGGIGAAEGWTTVLTRTPLGRAVLADARSAGAVADFSHKDDPTFATDALNTVYIWSAKKKKKARANRRQLGSKSVRIKD
ncbi:MAG: Coenzyme F420 hydrogenase/dehydrogenase, beta subunit C-terminal domain [Desulfobacterales bacterium]|jgi:coenzyme F420 hydrogenase subunit beta